MTNALIQIFTKPLTRPTIFIEIIQRIGCEYPKEEKKNKLLRGDSERATLPSPQYFENYERV